MLCDKCKKNPATIQITTVINGEKKEEHLCQSCAAATGALNMPEFSWQNFFPKLVMNDFMPDVKVEELHCPSCGLQLSQFNKRGLFGCPDCYQTFRSQILPTLSQIQANTTHIGKVPKRGGGDFALKKELNDKKIQLNHLVAEEKFEEAAKLRDEIKNLQNKMAKGDAQ